MAESVIRNPDVLQMEEDVLNRSDIHTVEVIAEGMCGDIVKVISVQKPEVIRVVKKFTLLDEKNKVRNKQLFLTEVNCMQSFSHPHLMKCIIAAECTNYMAIGMYYYPRGTLDRYVGELSPQLSEICVTQVACALRYMHNNHVAHIDVKLNNIFIDSKFNAILGDFGFAKELLPDQQTLPATKCGGTPDYCAPELRGEALNDKKVDPYKLDSYCLGVVLWALILEKEPDEYINYYRMVRKQRDLNKHIRRWLLKLLERNPVKRITVTEFLSRLRREGGCRHIIDNC